MIRRPYTHQFASTAAAARWRDTTVVVVVLLAGPVVLNVHWRTRVYAEAGSGRTPGACKAERTR